MITDNLDGRIGYELNPEEALRLGKLYLQQTMNGMGDAISLIPEIERLVRKGYFSLADIGTSSEDLIALLQQKGQERVTVLEKAIQDVGKVLGDTIDRLDNISKN
jgi:hypothetical protein